MPCPYSSEALRNDIRFWLNRLEQRHAGSIFTLFRSFQKISKGTELKTKAFRQCLKCGEVCPKDRDICVACTFLEELGVA
jgi:uncharacterized protein (TIGR00269 family)